MTSPGRGGPQDGVGHLLQVRWTGLPGGGGGVPCRVLLLPPSGSHARTPIPIFDRNHRTAKLDQTNPFSAKDPGQPLSSDFRYAYGKGVAPFDFMHAVWGLGLTVGPSEAHDFL